MVRKVGMIIFEGVQALDVSGPLDVFAEVTAMLAGQDGYEIVLIGPSTDKVKASNGMALVADLSFKNARGPFDLLLVAGGPSLPLEAASSELVECLTRLAATSNTYGSVCTGAFCLGEAGLLNGRKVTTHWQNAARLAERFPLARVEPDLIYVQDGPVITSAGVTAGIDLALSIVREHHGNAVALAVAKRLVVVAQRNGGQSQFSPYLELSGLSSSPLSIIAEHVMGNLRASLTVSDLGKIAGVSERSVARIFADEAKTTPAVFVENARIDAARNLLESGGQPLKVIAHDCGFGSPSRMRQVFSRRLGITPTEYRNRFALRSIASS